MSESVKALDARLAVAPPEQSAGPEGAALRYAWSVWNQDRSYLATVQPLHCVGSHPMTASVLRAIEEHPRRASIRTALEDFVDAVAGLDTTSAPPLHVSFPDDGSVLIEWTFADRRFGMSFEEDEKESGWYFVLSRESSARYEAGTMDQLNMEKMAEATLNA